MRGRYFFTLNTTHVVSHVCCAWKQFSNLWLLPSQTCSYSSNLATRFQKSFGPTNIIMQVKEREKKERGKEREEKKERKKKRERVKERERKKRKERVKKRES